MWFPFDVSFMTAEHLLHLLGMKRSKWDENSRNHEEGRSLSLAMIWRYDDSGVMVGDSSRVSGLAAWGCRYTKSHTCCYEGGFIIPCLLYSRSSGRMMRLMNCLIEPFLSSCLSSKDVRKGRLNGMRLILSMFFLSMHTNRQAVHLTGTTSSPIINVQYRRAYSTT